MRKTILFLITAIFELNGSAQIQHPTAWLRADSAVETQNFASLQNASSWMDVSGNGYNATPTSGAMPAAFSRMNFNKCFGVSGETFAMPLGINNTRQSDVIVVYETYDTANENALWQVQLDSTMRIGQTTRRILNDNGQITYDTVNRLKPVINYLAQTWRKPEVCAPTLTLCMADSLSLQGRVAEALYFDHRITDTAVIQWISYLAVKYGVTLAKTDYLDSHRNVIWDYSHYPDYNFSIAGVGRDDSVCLYQKQTYFADEQMIIGVVDANAAGVGANHYSPLQTGNNEDNPAFITDGDFILFGMDGNLPAVSEIYTQEGGIYEVIGRSMVQVTGGAHLYNTFILLDTAAVETQNFASLQSAPLLLIDRSGTGEFPASEMDQVLCAGTDTAGHYIYNNIHWDTDQNGRDFFCFAVEMPNTMGTPKVMAVNDGNNGATQDDISNDGRRDAKFCVSTDPDNGTNLKNATTSATKYRLLPNPNHGKFTVEIAYPEAQDVTVTVYDSEGRLLLTMNGKGQRAYRFENSVPAAGHYLIEISSPLEHKTLKMIVN